MGGQLVEHLEETKKMNTDIVCLYEINLNTTQYLVQKEIYETSTQMFDHHKTTFWSSNICMCHPFKPGGTMVISQGSVSTRMSKSGVDELGRWSYQTYSGKNQRNLTVISSYQPCKQKIVEEVDRQAKVKTMTVTAQQVRMLRERGCTKDPRKAFVQDLKIFIEKQREQNHGILLVGNFNEYLSTTVEGMTKLVAELNFTDVMFQWIRQDDFATYAQGKHRIDYILCNEWVSQALIAVCYKPFHRHTRGNHRNGDRLWYSETFW